MKTASIKKQLPAPNTAVEYYALAFGLGYIVFTTALAFLTGAFTSSSESVSLDSAFFPPSFDLLKVGSPAIGSGLTSFFYSTMGYFYAFGGVVLGALDTTGYSYV